MINRKTSKPITGKRSSTRTSSTKNSSTKNNTSFSKSSFVKQDPDKPIFSKPKRVYRSTKRVTKEQTNTIKTNVITKKIENKSEDSFLTGVQLNKFLAQCGVASRRESAELVKDGKVTVDGFKIDNPAHRVSVANDIVVNGKSINSQDLVYVLLNKPKNCITTLSDERGRKKVIDLVADLPERIYPIGRLDRASTGVLLLTNDGELAHRLVHPSFNISKVYEVKLDRVLKGEDFNTILKGVTLEDGFIKVDSMHYGSTKEYLTLSIHSGKNRIVRRIFASLDYKVKKLDRINFAGLNKKGVRQGFWRKLTPMEVSHLYSLVNLK